MRWIPAGLVCLSFLQIPPVCLAQDNQVTKLNLVIVEGEGAINNIRQRTARAPIVQVEDQNHRPVAGAAVTFMLPQRGASGVFSNGSRSVTVMTDSQGRAVANIKPNNVAGQMKINVNASFQGQVASAVITETNALAAAGAVAGGVVAKSIALKVIIAVAAAGAAAATGTVLATRGNDTTATNTVTVKPPVTISPGTGTVGAPR